jgi:hypothetical protein
LDKLGVTTKSLSMPAESKRASWSGKAAATTATKASLLKLKSPITTMRSPIAERWAANSWAATKTFRKAASLKACLASGVFPGSRWSSPTPVLVPETVWTIAIRNSLPSPLPWKATCQGPMLTGRAASRAWPHW